MKIIEIYANNGFKDVTFNEFFNVVLGKIRSSEKKDTHNLGKTALLRIIDFLLLSRIDKRKDELFSNEALRSYVFFGQFRLNTGGYLLIKRGLERPTKISFKISVQKIQRYPDVWDVENMPLEKAKEWLNKKLNFDVAPNWSFRKSITYFLRSQQDYNDVFKLSKFQGKDRDWKPFVFELLGFNGDIVKKKYEIEDKIKEAEERKRHLRREENLFDNIKKDELVSLLEIKQNELIKLEKEIDKFNFYTEDLNRTKELVDEIDTKLQILHSERYRILTEIKYTKSALNDISDEIDINELKQLYEEIEITLPDKLIKSYEDLYNFEQQIVNERKKYLSQNLEKLEQSLVEINAEIRNLEGDKANILSFLTEKDTYQKFKYYQNKLTDLKVEIKRLEDKIKAFDKIAEIDKEIEQYKWELQDAIKEIEEEINTRKHSELNKIFNDIIEKVVGGNAIISLSLNKRGNIEFNAEYLTENLTKTSQSHGTSYKKLLCVAFDLALLIRYSNKSFFKFVYHDGVLEGLDDRIKIRFINLVKEYSVKYNFQYILTLIDSDIPKIQPDIITEDDIVLELNDFDLNGKLFLRDF